MPTVDSEQAANFILDTRAMLNAWRTAPNAPDLAQTFLNNEATLRYYQIAIPADIQAGARAARAFLSGDTKSSTPIVSYPAIVPAAPSSQLLIWGILLFLGWKLLGSGK